MQFKQVSLMHPLCYFWLLLSLRYTVQNESPIVNTQLGTLIGHYKNSYDNRKFAAFEGIPYAKSPVGNLRFAEPQSPEPFTGFFNASTIHECAQHVKADLADANEDCLYLNVYVPRNQPVSDENLDVIFQIHGGAFMFGGPDSHGPEFLMHENVIYISISYRLGVFGFLSTGDNIVPGNNGLKDQVLALKWVKSNIKHFGGNPNSVTIVGVSSGGASVHLHYFSSLSKGLFHRGISHSGTALAPWAIHFNPMENTLKIAETVGCTHSSTERVIECLKTKSAKTLSEATLATYKYLNFPLAPFAPVIEKLSKTAFLTEHPYKLLQEGNVIDLPWISTVTLDEGLLILFSSQNLEEIFTKWEEKSPYILNYFQNVADVDIIDITKKIKKFYLKNFPITEKRLVKIVGDRLFRVSAEKAVHMQAKVTKSPVYFYVYGYESGVQYPGIYNLTGKGAGHGSDTLLIYDLSAVPKPDGKLSANDTEMKTHLINALITFAKDGVPKFKKINWEPVTGNEDWGYLHIHDKDNITMRYDKDFKLLEFWESLACDYWNKRPKL